MTNTGPLLWIESIQYFTNIWYIFCQRLLRPADVTFLKTSWWNSNGQLMKPLGTKIQKSSDLLSEPFNSTRFTKRHSVINEMLKIFINFSTGQEVKDQNRNQLVAPMAANLATCSIPEAFKCLSASELFLLDFLQRISIGVSYYSGVLSYSKKIQWMMFFKIGIFSPFLKLQ